MTHFNGNWESRNTRISSIDISFDAYDFLLYRQFNNYNLNHIYIWTRDRNTDLITIQSHMIVQYPVDPIDKSPNVKGVITSEALLVKPNQDSKFKYSCKFDGLKILIIGKDYKSIAALKTIGKDLEKILGEPVLVQMADFI